MSLNRSKPLKRTPMKKKKTEREWALAIPKVEGKPCRNCGTHYNIQPAHLVPRSYDPKVIGRTGKPVRLVPPQTIVPLCGPFANGCHQLLDATRLDLRGKLTWAELKYLVQALGKTRARRRISGGVA